MARGSSVAEADETVGPVVATGSDVILRTAYISSIDTTLNESHGFQVVRLGVVFIRA
jgi:hypothetical protein